MPDEKWGWGKKLGGEAYEIHKNRVNAARILEEHERRCEDEMLSALCETARDFQDAVKNRIWR